MNELETRRRSVLADVLRALFPESRFRWLMVLEFLVICAGVIYFIGPMPRHGSEPLYADPLHLSDSQKAIAFVLWIAASLSYLFFYPKTK